MNEAVAYLAVLGIVLGAFAMLAIGGQQDAETARVCIEQGMQWIDDECVAR